MFADRERQSPSRRETLLSSSTIRLPGLAASPSPRSSRGCSPSTIPYGACPQCDGLGCRIYDFDRRAQNRTRCRNPRPAQGRAWRPGQRKPVPASITCRRWRRWRGTTSFQHEQAPWRRAAQEGASRTSCSTARASDEVIKFTYRRPRHAPIRGLQEGIRGRAFPTESGAGASTDSAWIREELGRYQARGALRCLPRPSPQARIRLAVKIDACPRSSQVSSLSISDYTPPSWFARALDRRKLTDKQAAEHRAVRILKEIIDRLRVPQRRRPRLPDSLARASGHPLRRREPAHPPRHPDRLRPDAACSTCLDEPSASACTSATTQRLLASTQGLRDLGNTVLVVEHDEDAIRTADYVIDMGPGAGVHGGHLIAEGTPADIMAKSREHHRPIPQRRARISRSRLNAARRCITAG